MLVAHDGLNTATFQRALHDLMHEGAPWCHLNTKSGRVRGLVFRVIARAGAAAYQLLEVRHRTWPYQLFALLKSDDIAVDLQRLADRHPCVLDEYTRSFVAEHGGALTGPDAKAELELIARFADTDTASTEKGA